MKTLFLTSGVEDYPADPVLHGFRMLDGADCVDYPKCHIRYKNCSKTISSHVRGNGMTLSGLMDDDIDLDRFHIINKVANNHYDLTIIEDTFRHPGRFVQFWPFLTKQIALSLMVLIRSNLIQLKNIGGGGHIFGSFSERIHTYRISKKNGWRTFTLS